MSSSDQNQEYKNSNNSIVFQDEFSGKALDTGLWNTCYEWYEVTTKGCSNYGNDESEWYLSNNVTVADGYLTLKAQKSDTVGVDKTGATKNYSYSSGMVSSGRPNLTDKAKWEGLYGYYEARIKIPEGQGVWPAFWLLPTDHEWPPEIDIMEVLGNRPKQLIATYFWKDDAGNQAKDDTFYDSPYSFSEGWHTYGLSWKPGFLEWYVDGKTIKTIYSENVPSKPMQVILNLAIGGKLPGSPDETTPELLEMQVDYVRVYSEK